MTEAPVDLFLSLTPERVLDSIEQAGLEPTGLCYPLNSFENRVYEIELADRSRVVAKFYRPGRWSREQIREEHAFLAELVEDEIPAVPMRPFPDGETLRTIAGIHYAIADRRGGRAPEELSEETMRRLGRLVGRLHNVGSTRAAPSRLTLSAEHFVRDNVAWLRAQAILPPHLEARYTAAAEGIADAVDRGLAEIPASRIHRLHGDLHLGNLLLRDELLHVIDFDDMVHGPAVQDVWLALPGRGAEAAERLEAFLDGYEQFREFDRRTLALIEPLRGLRLVHYATWLARRWHDPAFPRAWPHFGTPEYWAEQTADLEEQLAVVRGQAEVDPDEAAFAWGTERGQKPAEAADEPPALTNRDFFWDWEGD